MVNEGEQDLTEYVTKSNLFYYERGYEVARKLIEMGIPPKATNDEKEIENMFKLAGLLD